MTITKKIIVDTPYGRGRLVWAGYNCYGMRIVLVRMLSTGTPWTFAAEAVEVTA